MGAVIFPRIFDNIWILHARMAVSAAGKRPLQGWHADLGRPLQPAGGAPPRAGNSVTSAGSSGR